MTLEQLRRELGLHEFTRDACIQGLLSDVFDEAPSPTDDEMTVTQVGPGRRSS